MKGVNRRLSQGIETIPPELQGTVDRHSTEEQRQVFLERIYADYQELQKQTEEVLDRKWKLDADVFQSHNKEIHDVLFGRSDGKESEMGDWDTWERVETIIKHCVYSRPSDFSTQRQHLQAYLDRIDVLNKAVVTQRQRLNVLNTNLNGQQEEISGLKNLLVLKEREIRTLRNQNTTYSLQIRHAKREVSRIRGTKMMVEEDELMKDFQLLLSANKELEKDNAAMRAKLHAKYGTAELNAIQQMQEREREQQEQAEAARLKAIAEKEARRRHHRGRHHHGRHHHGKDASGSAIHFLSIEAFDKNGDSASSFSSFSSYTSSSSHSSWSSSNYLGKEKNGEGMDGQKRHRRRMKLAKKDKKKKEKKMKDSLNSKDVSKEGEQKTHTLVDSKGKQKTNDVTAADEESDSDTDEKQDSSSREPKKIKKRTRRMDKKKSEQRQKNGKGEMQDGKGNDEASSRKKLDGKEPDDDDDEEEESEEEESEEEEEELERHHRHRSHRRSHKSHNAKEEEIETKEQREKQEKENNKKAFQGMMEALQSDQRRSSMLNSNVPVSSVLIRIKKTNMALRRRMELEVHNMMGHMDYDAGAIMPPNTGIAFTVPTFAFEEGPFTAFNGFRNKEEAIPILPAQRTEIAIPSSRPSIISIPSLLSSTTTAIQKKMELSGTVVARNSVDGVMGGDDSKGFSNSGQANALPVPPPPPPPLPPPLPPHTSTTPSTTVTSQPVETQKSSTQRLNGVTSANSKDTSARKRAPSHTFVEIVNTEKSWNSLKLGILGIAQLSRAQCLKREALHVLQLRQKLSYQQKQIDFMLLNAGKGGPTASALNLSETRIPKFLSGNFNSFSKDDDVEDDENEDSEVHHGSYVMDDKEDIEESLHLSGGSQMLRGFSVVDGGSSSLSPNKDGEKNRQSPIGKRESNTLLSELVDSPLGRAVRKKKRAPQTKGALSLSDLDEDEEEEDEEEAAAAEEHRRRAADRRRKEELMKEKESSKQSDASGSTSTPTGAGASVSFKGNEKGRNEYGAGHSHRSKNRSVVFQEYTPEQEEEIRKRYNLVLDENELSNIKKSNPNLLHSDLNNLEAVVQGRKLHVGGKRHDVEHRDFSSQSFSNSSPNYRSFRSSGYYSNNNSQLDEKASQSLSAAFCRALNSKGSEGGLELLMSELRDLRQCADSIKKKNIQLHEEVQEFIELLKEIFSSIDVIVEQRLKFRLQALAAPQGGAPNRSGDGTFQSIAKDFLEKAAEERVKDVLHHEHGIVLDDEDGDEYESDGKGGWRKKARRSSRDFTDEEWIADKLKKAAWRTAKSRIREEMDPFVSAETFRYYVGGDNGNGETRKNGLAGKGGHRTQGEKESDGAAEDGSHRLNGWNGEYQDDRRDSNDFLRMLMDAMPRRTGEGGLDAVPGTKTTTDLLRMMLFSNVDNGTPYSSELPRRVRNDPFYVEDDSYNTEDENENSAELDENGNVRKKPFHRVVRGHRMNWNAEHPFAALFPALYFDQETTMRGSWYRVPVGSHPIIVQEDDSNKGNSGQTSLNNSPGRHFRTAQSRDVLQMLRELQPRFSRAIDQMRPTVYHYDIYGTLQQELQHARQQMQNSLKTLFGDEFNDFISKQILPIASTAKKFASANRRIDPALLAAIKQLRKDEEARRKRRVDLLFRRVATNIRSRHMLKRPIYQGDAFLGYMGIMYSKWREKMANEEQAWWSGQHDVSDQLLEALHLLPDNTTGRQNLRGKGNMGPMSSGLLRGHFQAEKSSFHFEKAELPFDEKRKKQMEKNKRSPHPPPR